MEQLKSKHLLSFFPYLLEKCQKNIMMGYIHLVFCVFAELTKNFCTNVQIR